MQGRQGRYTVRKYKEGMQSLGKIKNSYSEKETRKKEKKPYAWFVDKKGSEIKKFVVTLFFVLTSGF